MKLLRFAPILALLATLLIVAFTINSGSGISVSYSPKLDVICSSLIGPRIEDQWKEELESRLDEYRSLWDRIGPRLLAKAEEISGLRPPASAKVRLTLCNVPSQSIFGISVNMRFAMQTFTATPVPIRYKVDTQFHELLHRMLDGHVPRSSRLLADQAGAPRCVKNHLHLLSLQKAVLIALEDEAALEDVVQLDSQLPDDCYREAWRIVNASESAHLRYVSEIMK